MSAAVPTPSPTETCMKPVPGTIIDDEGAIETFRKIGIPLNDPFFNSGKCLAWTLKPDDPAFSTIHKYVSRGQDHGFGVKILSVLRIIPQADTFGENSVQPFNYNEDPATTGQLKMMLWHGTRQNNLRDILENGLKLPTGHGQMFGPGIYFADRVSKSCQYCDSRGVVGEKGYLLLCEVLLGKVYNAIQAMPTLGGPPSAPAGDLPYTCVKGCGINIPFFLENQLIHGTIWPLGATCKNKGVMQAGNYTNLKFNEYIVYDTKRVQPKYLVNVEFTADLVNEQLN